MRSGSTLLKALLAEAPDVSHMPEFNFHKIREAKHIRKLHRLSEKPIVVLKKPAWYNEIYYYPKVPRVKNWKIIVLTRDVHHVVASLRKMTFMRGEPHVPGFVDHWFANEYWSRVYRRIHRKFGPHKNNPNVIWTRYEDLVQNPVPETLRLFQFIGSDQDTGVSSYNEPETFQWKWGSDDGGTKIQTLNVQPPPVLTEHKISILKRVTRNHRVSRMREILHYTETMALDD